MNKHLDGTSKAWIKRKLETIHLTRDSKCFCRWHDRVGAHHYSANCRNRFWPRSEDSNSFFHCCLRRYESNHELLHRNTGQSIWKKEFVSSRLDTCIARSFAPYLCAILELDHCSQYLPRHKPGINMVKYRSNEN